MENGDAGDSDNQDGQDDHGGGGVHCNDDHGVDDNAWVRCAFDNIILITDFLN